MVKMVEEVEEKGEGRGGGQEGGASGGRSHKLCVGVGRREGGDEWERGGTIEVDEVRGVRTEGA